MAFNTGNPVPSTDGRDLSDNAEALDKIVNQAVTVITRTGKIIKSIPQIVDPVDAAGTQGLIDIAADVDAVNAAADGFDAVAIDRLNDLDAAYVFTAINNGVWAEFETFTALNQYMVFSGTAYKPKNSTSLPYIVGATPVGDNNVEVVANLSTAQGDARYSRNFEILADAIAAVGLLEGMTFHLTNDRGNSDWNVVLKSTVTISPGAPEAGNIVASTGDITLALVLDQNTTANLAQHGGIGDGAEDAPTIAINDAAIISAIQSLRHDMVNILTRIGGSLIDVWSSGTVILPIGSFSISPDVLDIFQDLGLTIRGQGSRRNNNAVFGASELKIIGTSSGFALRVKENGGRGLTLEDFDLTYNDSNFTGDMIDNLGGQGLTGNRMYIGTHGISAGTRLLTARSIFRCTYDEFMHFTNSVFSGAVDGWFSDDLRDVGGNDFGGADTTFDNCTYFDFTGIAYRHDGNRTRLGLHINFGGVNPITVSCDTGMKLDNIESLTIDGVGFAPSTTFFATNGWLEIVNCTGKINGVIFGDLAKVGSISGNLDFSNNKVFCTDGLTLLGGTITGSGNEYAAAASGLILAPTSQLNVDVGPDFFSSDVTRSYDIPADNAFLAGFIHYAKERDGSTSKFRNLSDRVLIENPRNTFTISSTPTTISPTDTGKIAFITAATAVLTLEATAETRGVTYRIAQNIDSTVEINPTGGDRFKVGGESAVRSRITVDAGQIGAYIELKVIGGGFLVTVQTGNYTYV